MKQNKNSLFPYKFSEIKFLLIIFISSQFSLAQTSSRFFSEAPIYFENEVRYSNQIIVHFKNKIFDLPVGKNVAEDEDIEKLPSDTKSFFKDLKSKYGKFKFIKRIRESVWGDTLRAHIITGNQVKVHDYSQLFTIYFDNFVPIDSILQNINQRKEIQYADSPIQALSLIEPNDLLGGSTGNQWNLYKINAPTAWNITKGSSDIVVGMIEVGQLGDNGLPDRSLNEFTNTDQTSKFHPTKGDFVSGSPSGHANMVASMIGAATNDGDGFASLGWNILIAPYRYTEITENRTPNTLDQAIIRANEDGIKIINCSFMTKDYVRSPRPGCFSYQYHDYGSVRFGIEDALEKGITVIAATGNSVFDLLEGETCTPTDVWEHPLRCYPAGYDGVVGVGATTMSDGFAYSDYQGQQLEYNNGDWVDFCAPGKNILTVIGAGDHPVASGTSFASPQVAALVGLMKSLKSDLTTAQIEEILQSTVVDLGTAGKDNYFGYGRINAYKALKYTLENYGGILSGNINLTESLTINPGVVLTISSGSNIDFSTGVSLIVNGTLNAVNTTFTSSSNWGGIRFNSGSSGNLNGCTINKVQTYGGAAVAINNTSVTIQNCTIENNIGASYGISVIGNGNSYLLNNTIANNSNHGIFIYNHGNAFLRYNTITASTTSGRAAVYCDYYSTPLFGITSSPSDGQNTLQQGYYGLYANYYSNINAGTSSQYFNNRILNNSYANIYASNSYVTVQNVWWGTTQLELIEDKIISVGSTVTYLPILNSDPGQALNVNNDDIGDEVNYSSQQEDLINNKKKEIAKLWKEYKDSKNPEIINFLKELISKKNDPGEVRPMALEVLSGIYIYDKNISDAELLNKMLVAEYKETMHEKNGLMNLFFLYYNAEKYLEAKEIITRIPDFYKQNNEVLLANWLLGNDSEHLLKPELSLETNFESNNLPKEYSLLGNYPNPFNPSTTISYALPYQSSVELIIYDVMGREIKSFNNISQNAGTQNIVWDGRNSNGENISSGIYLYRIKVTSLVNDEVFEKSSKLMLMK